MTACYAVGPVRAPSAYIAANEPPEVWVVTGDSLVHVERPQVLGDTLAGFFEGDYREIALAAVSEVRVRRFDVARTVGAIAAAVVVGGLGWMMTMRRRRRSAARGAASTSPH
jgi:hypothetical protein